MKFRTSIAFLMAVGPLFLIGCGGSTPSTGCGACPHHVSTWTWVKGANTVDQTGEYGTQGTADPANVPGAREFAVSWSDNRGDLWLFGGNGLDSTRTGAYLNDLWKFDGTNWTWVSGSNIGNRSGVYGTKGTASAFNVPGARPFSVTWVDNSGNLWLFGGFGFDSTTSHGELNDLWKFDGSNWTWVSGASVRDQSGVYGNRGVPSASNVPGGRDSSVTWRDSNGNVWLFGGEGLDSAGANGFLNDLWKFDGTNWTWVSGSNVVNQPGVYGTEGTPASSNVPGARANSVSWRDASGNLWLFGGAGIDSAGSQDWLNDLWKFDGNNWTWVSGSNISGQPGVYGTQGTAGPQNVPGSRLYAASWTDSTGGLWLFGGAGLDSTGTHHVLNDLWKFDGTNWTWVGGSNIGDQAGVYGTRGAASASNVPGARAGLVSWRDQSGNLWLFGGDEHGVLNDLWEFKP